MLVFAVQNVISDPPFTRMDLIVCRNVLIYLDSAAQQQVLPAFHYALRPGGLLFLGSAENLGEADRLFESIDNKHKILRRRDLPPHARPIPPAATIAGRAVQIAGIVPGSATQQLSRSIERLLLEEFAPCSLVVDEHNTLIYAHGCLGMYFQPEQGQPRNDVLAMAREGLASPLSAALREAKRQEKEVASHGVPVRTNGEHTMVDLRVRPLTGQPNLRGLMLVVISPEEKASPASEALQEAQVEAGSRREIERELQHTRETLQTTIEELETSNEELKSSNEELQSTNEELQSTNEELETSKEEMQSLNEELNTVNAELQSKVNALARSNDDMNNLLNSMQVATIFLDSQMRVKRYTDQARDVVRLIGSDIGRPLSDLTSTLHYPQLIDDCRRVLATLIPKEAEVRDVAGRWYMVRLMPYRTADNVIDGVVMTMVDMERTKQAERVAAKGDLFRGVIHTVRQPLLVLDADLRVVLANAAFNSVFQISKDEVEGKLVYEMDNRQWDIPDLRRLLEEIIPKQTEFEDFPVEHEFPRIGRRRFMLNAAQIRRAEGKAGMIVLAFEDITSRG